MKKEDNFEITEQTTLRESLSYLGGISRADKTPTGKYLREKCELIAEAKGCKLYSNGYCYYENETSYTVLWAPECRNFTYYFFEGEPKPLPEGFLDAQPWYIAFVLNGDHRIEANNLNNRQGGRKGSKDYKSDDAGDHSGDAEDAIARAYHTSNIWREDYVGENPESIFLRAETRREMLDAMTEKQRQAFLLYFDERCDQQEIADLLHIGRTSARDRLYGAFRKAKLID